MKQKSFLVFTIFAVLAAEPATKTESPEATKLLADARAARAEWHHFPGFTADLEVNWDGKAVQGKLSVDAKGKARVELSDAEMSKWSQRSLASIVGHRLPGGDRSTPCFFPDDIAHHPLGRAIQVLNDEFHSSYRIRDKQVIVVNRTAKDVRFTITVLENHLNEERHFLPAHFVVTSWDLKSNQLVRSETHHQTWQRVGHYDLPRTTLVVTASAGKLEARSIKLSNVHLTAAAGR